MHGDHVELKMLGSRWRTVRKGTVALARNQAGTPIDGGGWTHREKEVGLRQIDHVNHSIGRKHGRL